MTTIASTDDIAVGQWYWVKDKEDGGWLGCIMEIGSNYLKLHSPHGQHSGYHSVRVHFDNFFSTLRYEPDPETVINGNVARFQALASSLINKVKEITARLGVSPHAAIADQSGSEDNALMVLSDQSDIKRYEKALIRAKDKRVEKLNY